MKRIVTAMALAALAAGGVAAAQDRPMMGDVTRVQAEAKAAEMFDRLDLNHDGKLDAADRAAHIQQMFDRIDTDHNGQISREEFAAAHMRGPGGPEGPGGPPPGNPGGDGKPGPGKWRGRGMGHPPWGGPMALGRMMRMADTDHDGAVSKAEFIAAALKRFDAADTNHDGTLTPAERQAARKAMRDKWRAMRSRGPGGAPGDMPPPPPPSPPPPPGA